MLFNTNRAYVFYIGLFCFFSCVQKSNTSKIQVESPRLFDESGKTIESRFLVPKGYRRVKVNEKSFGQYLRNLPLKKAGSHVRYFDGREKKASDVYCAVVDMPIGKKDLHQCADAVMHLRADFLWNQRRYDDIKFNLTNGFPMYYSEWRKGKRLIVQGNKTSWSSPKQPSTSYERFWDYLEVVFTYAGTLSLSKELKPVNIKDAQIGDVLIQGGSPGHAVLIVDVIERISDGKKSYLLAQSYMPAQEIQILWNLSEKENPWYTFPEEGDIRTPEWRFTTSDLKRF